jgi:hypothetical protein
MSRARAVTLAASVLALGIYFFQAASLALYPWDWSPDEGLFLEYARRFVQNPALLYPRSITPYPASHGPLQPVILAPIVALFADPIRPARVMAMGWTALIALAVYQLVRRKAPWPLALASSALALAPLDRTFWFMLLRVDGLMTAFWLLSALVLLPDRLERGGDRLSWSRATLGALLMLSAVLVKLSAIAHAAPLVLGWLLVDVASALRLFLLVGGGGLGALLVLQLVTAGGFQFAMELWKVNPIQPHLIAHNSWTFFFSTWTIVLFAAVGLLLAARARARPFRDGAVLLLLGGLAIVPAMAKLGAWWNYLLPLLCATVVILGRSLGASVGRAERSGPPLVALLALTLAATGTFPLPTAEDERTAHAFYDFVAEAVRHEGKPILAARPEYAYYVAGQPTEIEGASIDQVWAARVPGVELIRDRLDAADYGLVVAMSLPGDLDAALQRRYRRVGRCELSFFYGATAYVLYLPRESRLRFAPPSGTRCRAS